MARVIDLRNAGGQLVLIGQALGLPTSDATTFSDSEPKVAGSIRYNPTSDSVEFLSKTNSLWTELGAGGGGGAGYVAKAGDEMTGTLTLSGTARHLAPNGSASAPTYGFSTATTTGLALIGGGVATVIGGTARLTVAAASSTFANKVIGIDGSAAAPSVAFASSGTTGLYYSSSALRVSVAGTNVASFTSTGVTADLFTGVATSAQYADLAERYEADAPYIAATVVVFGGDAEITTTDVEGDPRVAGVISTNPAFRMNEDAGDDETHPFVALRGRVPCRVTGAIKKGDLLMTSTVPGHACAADGNILPGVVFAKALNDFNSETGIIEVVVI